jgi:HEAT repeat protein
LLSQRKWISALIAAAALSAAPRSLCAQHAAAPLALSLNQDSVRADLEMQGRILNDDQATAQAREEAARRLVSRPSAEADAILLRTLTEGKPDARLAAATALAADGTPNPDFIEPLTRLLDRDRALITAAAQALTTFKESDLVRTRMREFIDDARVSPTLRSPVIAAMARFGDKNAARTMIDILGREESPILRQAADEALAELTGNRPRRFDVQRWQQWWQVNRDKPEAEWAREFGVNQGRRLTETEQRLRALSEAMGQMMAHQFNDLPLDKRSAYLVKHLNDASEDVRAKAANLARQELVLVGRRDPDVFKALLGRIGDSSPEVRTRVIDTLGEWRDPEGAATEALVTQLAQETDTDMRVTIVNALAKSSDVRAVEPLLNLLHGQSIALARAAAEALKSREMAAALRQTQNQALHDRVATRLLTRFEGLRENDAATRDLRESVVEAMAALGHPIFQTRFWGLLGRDQAVNIRLAALRGLALIGDPRSDSANHIVPALNDPNAGIRQEASKALRTTGSFEHVDSLIVHALEDSEKDPDVRQAAWQSILALCAKAPEPRLLDPTIEKFNPRNATAEDHAHRQALFELQEQQYVKLLETGPNPDLANKLAYNRQNQADHLLLNLKRPKEAAPRFLAALQHWTAQNAREAVLDPIRQRYVAALLQGKDYPAARLFVKDLIERNQQHATPMWNVIFDELQRLKSSKDFEAGLELVRAMQNDVMPQPVEDLLKGWEQEFRKGNSGGFRIYVRHIDPIDAIATDPLMRLA